MLCFFFALEQNSWEIFDIGNSVECQRRDVDLHIQNNLIYYPHMPFYNSQAASRGSVSTMDNILVYYI